METALIIYNQGDNVPTLVDLYENESISLQYNFTDIKDLRPRGSYSRTFRIPATTTNSKIFGFIQENTYQFANFNPKRKLNAIITVDTIPTLEGSVQFKAVYTQDGQVHEYEIVFFGNVIDFFKNIGDADFKNFIGAQLQTDYPVVIEYDNIATINAETDIYLGLTDRGQNWVNNIAGGRSINTLNVDRVCKAGELTPFVSARYIFNKIMSLSGFSLGTDSDTLTSELDFMYIPWVSESQTIQQIGGNPETAKFLLNGYSTTTTINSSDFVNEIVNNFTYRIAHFPTLNEAQDPGGNVVGNVYTVPFNGSYKITASINLQVEPAFLGGDFYGIFGFKFIRTNALGQKTFLNNSGSIATYAFDDSGTQSAIVSSPIFGETGNEYQFLNEGDTIEVVLYTINTTELNLFTGDFQINEIVFEAQEISKPLFGNEIDWVANAPVMKCSEFIDSLFKMYNLVVVPNKFNQKLIDFIPFQEYISQGVAKDWTPLLDISKDITLMSTNDYQARKNTWTYKASSDLFNNIYNTQGNRVYGRLELIDPENDFATDENKVELYFGSTPIVPINGTTYAIPKFVSDDYAYSAPNPRILYKVGDTMKFNVYNDTTTGINQVETFMFSHYSDFVPDIQSRDLNFGQETPLCSVSSIPYKTLYARYWNEYIQNIYAPDARILEAFFSLEFADIYNFNFNDKIFIKDSYWRILSISDYVVGTQDTVKVTLIKQVTAEPDCLLTPDSITALGAVAFVDANGDPASATQTCCEVYNYNWIDGGCYAFSRDSDGTGKPKSAQLTTDRVSSVESNTKSALVVSDNNFIGEGNINSIVLGSGNRLDSGLDSVFVMGYNANVINGGATIGSAGTYQGEMQNGLIPMWGKGDFTNNTTAITLLAYGTTYINMPDDSVWLGKLRLMVGQVGAVIDASVSGEYNLHIVQSGGTLSLKNVTTIDETAIDIDGKFVIDLDIVGSTFAITVVLDDATAYPYNTINISAQFNYTQYTYA
jgi:hypothetical protein